MEYKCEEIGNRIKELRQAKGWTQKELSERLGFHGGGKQISKYESGNPIPPMDVLFSMCDKDIFDCELGYLLCEEEYSDKTKLLTAFGEYLGLSPQSIKRLHYYTGTDSDCFEWGYQAFRNRSFITDVLASSEFDKLLSLLFDYYDYINSCNDTINSLYEKYKPEDIKKAAEYSSKYDFINDPNAPVLSDTLYEIMHSLDKEAELKIFEFDTNQKAYKYELQNAFMTFMESFTNSHSN